MGLLPIRKNDCAQFGMKRQIDNLLNYTQGITDSSLTFSSFAHLAFEIDGENTSNEWLEPVNDQEYGQLR